MPQGPPAKVKIYDLRARLLAVDDEPDFLELIVDMLGDQTHSLHTAADPEEALAHLTRSPVDVMLVDLQMPRGGGRRLLEEARRRHPDAYSIVVTGYGNESVAVEMLKNLGAFGYISKTDADHRVLLAAVRRAMLARHAGRIRAQRGFEVVGDAESADDTPVLYPMGQASARPNLQRLTALAEALDEWREAGRRCVLVDLTHLESAAAVALGYLWEAVVRMQAAGGRVALCAANRLVMHSLAWLEAGANGGRGLAVFGDRQAALAALTDSAAETAAPA